VTLGTNSSTIDCQLLDKHDSPSDSSVRWGANWGSLHSIHVGKITICSCASKFPYPDPAKGSYASRCLNSLQLAPVRTDHSWKQIIDCNLWVHEQQKCAWKSARIFSCNKVAITASRAVTYAAFNFVDNTAWHWMWIKRKPFSLLLCSQFLIVVCIVQAQSSAQYKRTYLAERVQNSSRSLLPKSPAGRWGSWSDYTVHACSYGCSQPYHAVFNYQASEQRRRTGAAREEKEVLDAGE